MPSDNDYEPGKWYSAGELVFLVNKHGGNRMTALVQAGHEGLKRTPPDEVSATAQRFAASADLLAALRDIVGELKGPMMGSWTEGMDNFVQAAEAAIAKAKGETR